MILSMEPSGSRRKGANIAARIALIVASLSISVTGLGCIGSRPSTIVPILKPKESIQSPFAGRVLRVGGDQSYPPFEYITESGEAAGFSIELLRIIADKMGLSIEIELSSWTEARSRLEQGQLDILPGMYRSPDRELLLDFAIPHYISSFGVFALKDSGIKSSADIKDKRIATQKGDLGYDYLKKNNVSSSLVVVENWQDVFNAVARGEADCAVYSILQGSQAIREKAYSNIRAVGKPILQAEYCMAVKKGDAALLAILNEGLSVLRSSGEYDALYRKWFNGFQPGNIDNRIVGLLAVIIAIIVTVGVFLSLWSLILRARVREKTALLESELSRGSITMARLQKALIDIDEAKAEAQRVIRDKSAFVASISHELRTPLHGILGAMELLCKTELDEDQSNMLSMARASADQLSRIMSDLLDAIGAERGALRIEPTEFSFTGFSIWLESVLRPSAEDRGLAFRFTTEGDEMTIYADKSRIAQVIMNLCANAIKYTDRGDVELDLKLRVDSLYIVVKDTGPGIPEESKDKIFKPFYRVDRAEQDLPEGLGLGLSIVKGIVDAMGGFIRYDTHPSMGTRFEVSLPIKTTPKIPQPGLAAMTPPEQRLSAAAEAERPARAIIAEDEAINRIYIKHILEAAGYETRQAADGVTALEAATEGLWDFILMDVSMPHMDGLEATRRIRAMESARGSPRTPIVALTAHAYAEDRQACLQAGMDGFLSKPFTEAALWREVKETLAAIKTANNPQNT